MFIIYCESSLVQPLEKFPRGMVKKGEKGEGGCGSETSLGSYCLVRLKNKSLLPHMLNYWEKEQPSRFFFASSN